ncbi:MAG TPA: Mut7-C ubiquitin/RNAse domain-containing protein [Anaerolineae bacterium]|nr:Mut7-C ubiquitin/RNAse domain-containing protein [Anaerolineae bacterium]
MNTSYFRFYAELNDYLPADWRYKRFPYQYENHQTIKHLIESWGVPHTQVGLILINGISVAFSSRVADGLHVSVFPYFSRFKINELSKVLSPEIKTYRFINDGHLGKLTTYMRLLGLDVLYRNNFSDKELVEIAITKGRILLTRDRNLLKRREVVYGYCISTTEPREQLIEILRRFHLTDKIHPFKRCPRCNGILKPIEKEKILHRLEPKTKRYYNEFKICDSCSRIYWKGSHYGRITNFIKGVIQESKVKIY